MFEKDVKVEKDGDKFKYTFKVKEANGNTLITKRTKYQFSKITHNGENVLLTEQADKVKEAVLTTDKLLDKIQLKTTVVSKYDKAGNEVDTTLDLDFLLWKNRRPILLTMQLQIQLKSLLSKQSLKMQRQRLQY